MSSGPSPNAWPVRHPIATLAVLICLGAIPRVAQLGQPLLVHDEVATALQARGTCERPLRALFADRIVTAGELAAWSTPDPALSWRDTLRCLAHEDPKHPPLYFVATHGWMDAFGGSRGALRALPVLGGLVAIPLVFWLGRLVAGGVGVGLLAAALMALSPLEIAMSRSARQYSWLLAAVLLATACFVRVLQRPTAARWAAWVGATAFGLYLHPLYGSAALAHALVALFAWWPPRRHLGPLVKGAVAAVAAGLLYLPWFLQSVGRINEGVDWAERSSSHLALVQAWVANLASLVLATGSYDAVVVDLAIHLPVVVVVVAALLMGLRTLARPLMILLAAGAALPFFVLAIPDLAGGGARSGVVRYLTPSVPFVVIAVAIGILRAGRWPWLASRPALRWGILFVGLATVAASDGFKWHRLTETRSERVMATAERELAADARVLLVADRGRFDRGIAETVGFAAALDPSRRLLLLGDPPDPGAIPPGRHLLLRPSRQLVKALEAAGYRLSPLEHGLRYVEAPAAEPNDGGVGGPVRARGTTDAFVGGASPP